MHPFLSTRFLPSRLIGAVLLALCVPVPAQESPQQTDASSLDQPVAGTASEQASRAAGQETPDTSRLPEVLTSRNGRPLDAREVLEQRRRQAQAAYNRGQYTQALSITNAALQQAPNDARLRFLKGVTLRQLKQLDDAAAEFRGLIDEYPELPEPYNNLAVVLAAKGELDEARLVLEQAILAVPTYGVAYENLGNLHLALAQQRLQRARQLMPDNQALARKLRVLESIDSSTTTEPASSRQPASSQRTR